MFGSEDGSSCCTEDEIFHSELKPVKDSSQNTSMKFKSSSPEEFVRYFEGNRFIKKILIANNGIAAVKCMRSMRSWSYEMFKNERAIKFFCMVTPEDLKANAEYIRMADATVAVPGGSNNNNYANVKLICDIAVRLDVSAVWVGWGHASENPNLPELLQKENIIFIGPDNHSMWLLGDKIASTIVAQSIGIPTLPWSGSHIILPTDCRDITRSDLMYESACVDTFEEALSKAENIGYPLMIKTSEGGGGKGIRRCDVETDLANLYEQVKAESPGSHILIMKCITQVRHVEVQILADEYGEAISLFGRDCSVQRRNQKIIEEAPVTVVPSEIFELMEKNAIQLTKLVGYRNCGTVEYLYQPNTKEFYFLELNPRLQVEHPCTEEITDINLLACQLQIAMGIPLHRIRDIRTFYKYPPWDNSLIPFSNPPHKPQPKGHVIAARITSENPNEGFKPTPGSLQDLNFKSNRHVWGYFSVSSIGEIHEYADSQFGHCFSWALTRENARENLVLTLKDLIIRGDLCTTVEYLVKILESSNYMANNLDTEWLGKLIGCQVQSEKPKTMIAVICTSLHIAIQQITARFQSFQMHLQKGHVTTLDCHAHIVDIVLIYEGFKYCVQAIKSGLINYCLIMNSSLIEVEVHLLPDNGLLMSVQGCSHTTYMHEDVSGYRTTVDNKSAFFNKVSDPSSLKSPSTGKLISCRVEDGGHVHKNDVYATMEVMKLVMELRVPESGTLHFMKFPGASLQKGMEIARLILDDPTQMKEAPLFTGKFFPRLSRVNTGSRTHQVFTQAKYELEQILNGYSLPEPYLTSRLSRNINMLMTSLRDPKLPLLELQEVLSQISGHIPFPLENAIQSHIQLYACNLTSIFSQFPSAELTRLLDYYATLMTKPNEKDHFYMTTQCLKSLVERYDEGIRGHMRNTVQTLLQKYIDVEGIFQKGSFIKCMKHLLNHSSQFDAIVKTVFSKTQVVNKNKLILMLIDHIVIHEPGLIVDMNTIFNQLASLTNAHNAKVALKARQVLIASKTPTYELQYNQLEAIFLSSVDPYAYLFQPENLNQLIQSETVLLDVLLDFFYHKNDLVKAASLEVYIRRAYIAYDITSVRHKILSSDNVMVIFYFLLPSNDPKNFRQSRVIIPSSTVTSPSSYFYSKKNSDSANDLINIADGLLRCVHQTDPSLRMGVMAAFNTLQDFESVFDEFIEHLTLKHITDLTSPSVAFQDTPFHTDNPLEEPIHIINVALRSFHDKDDDSTAEIFQKFCHSHQVEFLAHGIRRITFIICSLKAHPKYFTFRGREHFQENLIYRHLEPALSFQLEINRMSNFELENIPVANRSIHLYLGKAKVSNDPNNSDYRFFVRAIIRHEDLVTNKASFEYLANAAEEVLLECMDALSLAFSHSFGDKTDCNHIFLNFVPVLVMADTDKLEESVRNMALRYGWRLWSLRVLQAELKINIRKNEQSPVIPLRLFLANENGYLLDMCLYEEVKDSRTGNRKFCILGNKKGRWDQVNVDVLYDTKTTIQLKRSHAQRFGTTYVYDFPEVFQQVVLFQWRDFIHSILGTTLEIPVDFKSPNNFTRPLSDFGITVDSLNKLVDDSSCWEKEDIHIPDEVVHSVELSLDKKGQIYKGIKNDDCQNIGVVAWQMTLHTPEYPVGRDIIVIANDITHQMGSFSTLECKLFEQASKLARDLGIPRLYISATCGARMGINQKIRKLFKVAWLNPDVPDAGFKHLYLDPKDYEKDSINRSVHCEFVQENDENRYVIEEIVDAEDHIGVENLHAAAFIARETACAYKEIVTMGMVTCRSVGIGSYLLRLGQRVVQLHNSSILLTGCLALNKVLGRQLYTDNNQLGGIEIMANNGVSHTITNNDFEGVLRMIQWLSYCPARRGDPLPIHHTLPLNESIERQVEVWPSKSSYDPRILITGKYDSLDHWQGGLFDRDSWQEILSHWAKTVVVGRARLGGIPVGVIAVETRFVEVEIPADPANEKSQSSIIHQPGQVWFPDSAHKTAQAIRDFQHEELPLIILANWRGFASGMKEMYEEILKYGSLIVDNLHSFTQPVLVYIPPYAELRGGAWVVIDPAINSQYMELFADKLSRGGVVEPEAMVEIKYKETEIIKTIHRLDPKCCDLIQMMNDETSDISLEQKKSLDAELTARVTKLLPIYMQIAIRYASLHDTPGRMLYQGVIQQQLHWPESRTFLYWRLSRRLNELNCLKLWKKCLAASGLDQEAIQHSQAMPLLAKWFEEDQKLPENNCQVWKEDDSRVSVWLQSKIKEFHQFSSSSKSLLGQKFHLFCHAQMTEHFQKLLMKNPDSIMQCAETLVQMMNANQREQLSQMVQTTCEGNSRSESTPISFNSIMD